MGHPGIGSRSQLMNLISERFTILKESRRGAFKTCRDVSFLLQKL